MSRLVRTAVLLALLATTARGQERAWGFVNVKYDTRSSTAMYTGYGWRNMFAMAGVLNTRSGQAEVLGGLGASFHTGRDASHWLAVAKAQTGPVSTVQVYWLPTLRSGSFMMRANAKWTIPYKGSTVRKLSVAPLAVTRTLVGRLSGGLAMDLSAADGARTNVSAGFQLRLRVPRAAVNADLLRDVSGNNSRLRVFFASLF